jgi:hypothetical protein
MGRIRVHWVLCLLGALRLRFPILFGFGLVNGPESVSMEDRESDANENRCNNILWMGSAENVEMTDLGLR